ncbi:GMC oxidoreductase [Lewinella cohaerens]|uniref:GMC oxidoreductase n=1 Tax=Lewinella cohaerens TaxID=70995 RepID=UPI0003722293|nr:GMC family oxidoreductase [Lewinella cohaerens]
MFFNSQGKAEVTYDAIVVGSGISGGWAAKELSQKGLKTLVLERGRNVRHGEYPTAGDDPWDYEGGDRVPPEEVAEHYPKQDRTGYTVRKSRKHFFVKDSEHPYSEVKRFDWIRGYHTGGRSLMWGRQSYRLSDLDFAANERDGIAVDWPIRYADMAPWYNYVETFAGISGQAEGLAHLPDGNFLPPMELNCVEKELKKSMATNFDGRLLTIGRTAHLTEPNPAIHGTRGKCQSRNRCMRGCPFGAYFSSNASTLPAAEATGNMTLRPHSVVHSIIMDKETGKAKGVRVIDGETGEQHEFFAKIVFLCASALGSTFILMNSQTEDMPEGLGSSSGQLGRNLMDHHFKVGARGRYEGFEDMYYKGRRPNGFYIPRFRNIDDASKRKDYIRGFGYQGGASRTNWMRGVKELEMTVGADFKDALVQPGPWQLGMNGFGECLPYEDNRVYLNHDVKDIHGLPTLTMDAEFKGNEMAMRKDMAASAAEMLEAAGFKDIETYDDGSYPGLGIHEMGTARMGRDPKTSVLNKWNQVWEAPNVFVTDGAAMTSAACQNPSLTYMALTARAADYAVSELKKMNL